jgi:hypothetical protein
MTIEVFSMVIVIAIGEVPVVAVHIAAAPVSCSAVIGEMVATPNPGSFAAFEAASRTIAAPQTWAATVAAAPKRGSASATTVAAASKRGTASATAVAATAPTATAPTSASATVVGGEID